MTVEQLQLFMDFTLFLRRLFQKARYESRRNLQIREQQVVGHDIQQPLAYALALGKIVHVLLEKGNARQKEEGDDGPLLSILLVERSLQEGLHQGLGHGDMA